MNIRALNDSLSTKLGLLKQKINIENKSNVYGLNQLLETSSAKILNILYDYELFNANLLKTNFPGVDLIESHKKLLVQVSSTGTFNKITHTLKQIKKLKIDNKFKRLHFVFLGDVSKFSVSSKKSIEKLIPHGLDFNIDEDIYDVNKIYSELFNEQNISKTLSVIKILDEILGFTPQNKSTGYESISIAFADNDTNVSKVIDYFLREGINVYISSKKMYEDFVKSKHRLLDYLILLNDSTNIEHVKYTLVCLSNEYIIWNEGLKKVKCPLLKNALTKDTFVQLLNFDNSIKRSLILNRNFQNSIPCTKANLKLKLDLLLNNFFKEESIITLNRIDIISELKKNYKNFKLTKIHSEESSSYSLLKFDLEDFPNMAIYYVIFAKNYVLNSVEEHFNKYFSNIPVENTIALAPKDPLQKTNRRIDNIKRALGLTKVHYVSDHLYEKTLKKEPQNPISEIDDFVAPIINFQKQNLDGIDAIINWVTTSSDSSVAMISGQGGIGKTTLSEKIHDKLINESNNYYVIFISSSQLINELEKVDGANKQDYDIYNLYRISQTSKNSIDGQLIDRASFEIHYELGNINDCP